MTHPKEFHQIVVSYLAKRCSFGDAPSTDSRCLGDYMDPGDFSEQLTSACEKGRDLARSRVLLWATTGKAISSSGVAGFVLYAALQVAQRRLGSVLIPSRIKAVLSGPPWSEATAVEIADEIFDEASYVDLQEWIEDEARS